MISMTETLKMSPTTRRI
jgi:hypothetical protein